jgi:glycerol-3-phosphate dehydrogenase subunit C
MSAEDKLRYEINYCAGCDVCRDLLDLSCLVFPEIFRLYDRKRESGEEISTDELRNLVGLCNFCALCPCRNIREALLNAKTEYGEKFGLGFKTRVIENVDRFGRLGGTFRILSNFFLQSEVTKGWIQRISGIHGARKFPKFPKENFPKWISRRNENRKTRAEQKRKVAYFSGCTAKFFFPQVAKAFVEVFEMNGIQVYYPDQTCCGMPPFLEGDTKLTMKFVQYNLPRLLEVAEKGYDIVCSCPTCGYMLKCILKAGAYHSPEFTDSLVVSDGGFVKLPRGGPPLSSVHDGFGLVWVEFLHKHLKDEGYFSSISARKRIKVAESTYDAGEYLLKLHSEGELNTKLGPFRARAAYYPPCHLREQKIGRPYFDLLGLIPGLSTEAIDEIYCCGNAGIMGFKSYFHPLSIKISGRLIAKLKRIDPKVIATDCISCRLQFNQLTPYRVLHPLEIIKESYRNYQGQAEPQKA